MSVHVSLSTGFLFGPQSNIIYKKETPVVHVWSIHGSWPEGKAFNQYQGYIIITMTFFGRYVTFQYRFIFGTMVVYVMTMTQVIDQGQGHIIINMTFFSERPNGMGLVFLIQIWFHFLCRYYYTYICTFN